MHNLCEKNPIDINLTNLTKIMIKTQLSYTINLNSLCRCRQASKRAGKNKSESESASQTNREGCMEGGGMGGTKTNV